MKRPTRDGDRELAILTNLHFGGDGDNISIAEVYRQRWSIET